MAGGMVRDPDRSRSALRLCRERRLHIQLQQRAGEGPAALGWLARIDLDEIEPQLRYLISAYYSPFLAKLEGTPEWDDYRSRLLQVMRGDGEANPVSSALDSTGCG